MDEKLISMIGIPWKLGGRDRGGIDCLGLVILAERELFGVRIPDLWNYNGQSYGEISRKSADIMDSLGYLRVKVPENGDIALLELGGFGHLGVWIEGGVLSIVEKRTSTWKRRTLPFLYFRPGR